MPGGEEPLEAPTSSEVPPLLRDPDRRRSVHALPEPWEESLQVPTEEIRRELNNPERQRAEERRRQRQQAFHDDARRMLHTLRHQRAQEQVRQRQEAPRRRTIKVPEHDLARTIAALTQQRSEERLQAKAARVRAKQDGNELNCQKTRETPQALFPDSSLTVLPPPPTLTPTAFAPVLPPPPTQPPTTPPPARPPPPRRMIPYTPPAQKRRRNQQPEGLPTPPPSGSTRPPKRPRPMHEISRLQQESVDAVIQYHESSFREKRKASVGRSWCKEISLAHQVDTARTFYQAFIDEKTLPILHCVFCYRKLPPCKITTTQ